MRGRQRNRGSIDARNAAMQATMCSLSRNKVDVQVRVEEGGESGCGPRNLNPLRSLVLLAVNSRLRVFVSPMEEDLAQSVC
jgi:hypothetical protein